MGSNLSDLACLLADNISTYNVFSQDSVALNLRREVFGFGMQMMDDETTWNVVWDRYITATSPHERDDLSYGLSQTTDPTLIRRPV